MNVPGIDEIDGLLKEYELQEREVYINRTIPAIDRLEGIARRLAGAYEMEYRANSTYENESACDTGDTCGQPTGQVKATMTHTRERTARTNSAKMNTSTFSDATENSRLLTMKRVSSFSSVSSVQ